ncbi:MAG: hypothetical protein CM1200mP25_3920 [Acidobacteriota bacterium]|nr:MAG: hypothetical protein CM1200mP25_3920 [Acidobacteriota bacterium]
MILFDDYSTRPDFGVKRLVDTEVASGFTSSYFVLNGVQATRLVTAKKNLKEWPWSNLSMIKTVRPGDHHLTLWSGS